MSYKMELLPEARLDIKESIEWHDDQKAGLGKRFYKSVKSRFQYIRKNPLHYQITYRGIRNALLHKFPYQIHYRVDEANRVIIVFGVTHTSRNPQIWKTRK